MITSILDNDGNEDEERSQRVVFRVKADTVETIKNLKSLLDLE